LRKTEISEKTIYSPAGRPGVFYKGFPKSFNIPEFSTFKVDMNPERSGDLPRQLQHLPNGVRTTNISYNFYSYIKLRELS